MVTKSSIATIARLHWVNFADDGIIRQCSLGQLTERRGLPKFAVISDVPLNGSIVALYLVQNERTNVRFIIGGSDDGCVALWSQESVSPFRATGPYLTSLRAVPWSYAHDGLYSLHLLPTPYNCGTKMLAHLMVACYAFRRTAQ